MHLHGLAIFILSLKLIFSQFGCRGGGRGLLSNTCNPRTLTQVYDKVLISVSETNAL